MPQLSYVPPSMHPGPHGSSWRRWLGRRARRRVALRLAVRWRSGRLARVFALECLDHPLCEIDRGLAVHDQRAGSGIPFLHDQRDIFSLGDLPHHLFDLFGEVAEQLTFLGLDLPFELLDMLPIGEQLLANHRLLLLFGFWTQVSALFDEVFLHGLDILLFRFNQPLSGVYILRQRVFDLPSDLGAIQYFLWFDHADWQVRGPAREPIGQRAQTGKNGEFETLLHMAHPLFVPQSIDRIQARGLVCRIKSEHEADQAGEAERQDHDVEREDGGPSRVAGDERGPRDTAPHPQDPADHAQDDRLDQELPQDVPALGADRHADADLPGPLRD